MPEHPGKNLESSGAAIPQTKSKEERHAERPTGMLPPGSKPITTPTIGTQTGPAKNA